MTTQPKLLTYADYLNGPETKERREIVDGEVIMVGSPDVYHQTALRNACRTVDRFVYENGLGEVWFAPLDVIVELEPLRVRQPDLLFVSNDRTGIIRDRIYGGPDLVVEVISPNNSRAHIESKLADYASIEVRECWLISPLSRTVEPLSLEAGEWRRDYIRGVGERVESVVLPGLELDISEIFQGI